MTIFNNLKNAFSTSGFEVTYFTTETESKEYEACNFKIKDFKIYFRKAKITPIKEGQFITFWKRIPSGIIAPFDEKDDFDFLMVSVESENESGYFVFPKYVLITKKIISTSIKEGKRAFRVYPPWSVPANKQALASQKWQSNYYTSKISLGNFMQK